MPLHSGAGRGRQAGFGWCWASALASVHMHMHTRKFTHAPPPDAGKRICCVLSCVMTPTQDVLQQLLQQHLCRPCPALSRPPTPLVPCPHFPLPYPAGLAGQVLPDHCGGQGADGAWPPQRHCLPAAHPPAAQPHQGRRPLLRLQSTLSVCPSPHACSLCPPTLPPLFLAAASAADKPPPLLQEVSIMSKLRHPNICQYLGECTVHTWMDRGRSAQAYCPLQ